MTPNPSIEGTCNIWLRQLSPALHMSNVRPHRAPPCYLHALVTSCVHFAVLTLSREPAFKEATWSTLVFAFQWPSVVYAMEILAWDIFFPLAALCAAGAIQGSQASRVLRAIFFLAARHSPSSA